MINRYILLSFIFALLPSVYVMAAEPQALTKEESTKLYNAVKSGLPNGYELDSIKLKASKKPDSKSNFELQSNVDLGCDLECTANGIPPVVTCKAHCGL